MARRRSNIVVTMSLVFAAILMCAPHTAAKDCLAIVDEAYDIQKRLSLDRPSRAGQIEVYEKLQKVIGGCQGASLPSHIQFEIETLKIEVSKQLKKLKHRKGGVPGVPVDCETRYKDCYQTYVRDFKSIRDLSCDEAATLINTYYDAAWEEFKEDGSKKDRAYRPETLRTLWRLLWRISRSDCVKSEEVKTAVRKVFFPHSVEMEEIIETLMELARGASRERFEELLIKMDGLTSRQRQFLIDLLVSLATHLQRDDDLIKALDPDDLARSFSSLTREDPSRFIQFIGAMGHLTAGQRLDLIDEFIAEAKGMDNAQATHFRRLLSHLPTMDQHRLEKAISLLHKVPWSLDDAHRDAVDNIPEDKVAKILAHEFRLTDPQPDKDQMLAAKALNDAFQYPTANGAYQTISVREKADVALSGTIDLCLAGDYRKYRLHYRFVCLGPEKSILFQNTMTVAADEVTQPETLRKKARLVYEDFLLFIAMMRLMDAAETHAAVTYLKGEKPAMFIQRALIATTRLFGRAAPDEWESVRKIVVHPEFWGQYPQKAANILNTGYQEAIMERLQALYKRSYHALVEEGKEHPDTLEVYGENHGPLPCTSSPSDEKQSRLSIIFEVNYEKKASTDLHLPQAMIENEPETVKQIIARIVCRSIAVFLNFRPEPLDLKKLAPPYEYPLVASFFLPGIWRQGEYNYIGRAPSLKLKAWNYSNLALLGVTIGAEAVYIGSDYESDALFWTAVGGTGLFLLNGSVGLIDAWIHHRDTRATAPTSRPRIELQGAQSLGSHALVLSIPF